MANTLIVPDEAKTPKESILLGDVTVQLLDCEGNQVEVHGLTANDLIVKTVDGTTIPLVQYVEQHTSVTNVTNATATSTAGNNYTLQSIVDGYEEVQFSIAELQQKYDNL